MKLLICVAGMPWAKPTISFGGLIARVTGAQVTLLHVVSRKEAPTPAEEMLARAREMLPDQAVQTRLCRGDPVTEILAEARRGSYDLLAVGARRDFGLTLRFLGSVSLAVVRRAPTCVLVVPQSRPQLRRVLICTSGIEIAEPVIETGARLAGAAGARATLLHVSSPVPSMYTGLAEIEETLPELLQTETPIARHLRHGAEILARHRVQAELELRYGVAADEILHEAHQGDYDLIVIGASGATGRVRSWLLGDVTRQVIDSAVRPVLVVRHRGIGTECGAQPSNRPAI